MFKFLTKTLFAVTVWRQYKRIIVSTIVLFISYAVVSAVHGDYVSYAVTAKDTSNLFLSYVIKWLALAGLAFGYYFFNRKSARVQVAEKTVNKVDNDTYQKNEHVADPFSEIRKKSVLGQGSSEK